MSTLASLLVSVTVTPVLAFYLLPRMKNLDHGDTRVVAWLKARYRNGLVAVLARPRTALAVSAVAVALSAAAVPFFPTTFLPPFNEGTLLIGMRLNPGVTLAEPARSTLWSTAYMDEASRFHRVALMHAGQALAVGRPSELLAHAPGCMVTVHTEAQWPALAALRPQFAQLGALIALNSCR